MKCCTAIRLGVFRKDFPSAVYVSVYILVMIIGPFLAEVNGVPCKISPKAFPFPHFLFVMCRQNLGFALDFFKIRFVSAFISTSFPAENPAARRGGKQRRQKQLSMAVRFPVNTG